MPVWELWLIYALVFGAALLAVQGLYWAAFRGRHEQQLINRRLALTDELASPTQVMEALRKERSLGLLARAPILSRLEKFAVQSGLTFTPSICFGTLFLLFVCCFVPFGFLLGFGSIALGFAILVATGTSCVYLILARRRRIARFTEQLPDALDVIVRGLRAGHPFRVALGLVAREMPDPIGTEFGILADEITFGLEQKTAFDHLSWRVGQPDLSFFSIAVNIQSETGGNLAEILHRLSQLLRSRLKLRLKVRAISSEGRLSAVFLSAMPFILILIILAIAPTYFSEARLNPAFPAVVVLGLLLLTCGNFIMYRMVNFKY